MRFFYVAIDCSTGISIPMRFLHTADWHLGKLLHGVHLTDDQRVLLDQLINVAADAEPDLVIVAGDVYDRSVPPADAVKLLDDVLSRIVLDLGIPVVAIAGNHDSPDRLDFGSTLLQRQQLYVYSKLRADPGRLTLEDEHGPVHVVGLPYAEPSRARNVFEDPSIKTHDGVLAAQAKSARAALPDGDRSIAVGHVFTQGGELADSERPLAVGGAETVHTSRFDGFDYVALGHLHRRQKVRDPRIQYAGSLMKYSFNEVHHDKSAHLVEMDATGDCTIERVPLMPQRDLRRLEGPLSEILNGPAADEDPEDYLWVTLTDEGPVVDAMSRIRAVYPNALHVERTRQEDIRTLGSADGDVQSQNVDAVFKQFFEHVTDGDPLSDAHQDVLGDAIDRMQAAQRDV